MQIVFLNTFERSTLENGVLSAQLSICERQGEWVVIWMEGLAGQELQENWYEGLSWEDMMIAFRHGVAKKMGAGYVPIIDGMLDDRLASAGNMISMLQCYGELHANEQLFQKLREWRRSKAVAEKKSAFLVVTNRILWMISAFIPHTEEELKQIPGWGAVKHSAYGAEVLAITNETEQLTSFPLDWVDNQLNPAMYTEWLFKQKETKFKGQMERQKIKKHILSAVQQGSTIAELQSTLELSRRELLDRIEQLEQEGYDMEPLINRELSVMTDEEQQQIWEALQAVGDRYLKPLLQHVYGSTDANELPQPVELLYERLRLIRMRYRRATAVKAV